MPINKESFLRENIVFINKIFLKILLLTNLVPISLIFFSYVHVFQVSIKYAILILCYTISISIIYAILIKSSSNALQKLAMYFGLISLEVFIVISGFDKYFAIYLTFGIIPVISCLYYNRKLSIGISLFCYFSMIFSLFLRFKINGVLFQGLEKSITKTFIPVSIGFTIEYFFISLTVIFLTNRNLITLNTLIKLNNNANSLTTKLKNSNKTINSMNDEIENLERNNFDKSIELQTTQEQLIDFIAASLKSHDLLTGFHVEHTKKYVEMISRKLRNFGLYKNELTDERIKLFSEAAFLHDIGKLHTPEGVLNKPGKFTNEEFEMMKRHPQDGADLIRKLPTIGDGRFNKIAIDIAFYHHEKWNGTGYPMGLSETDIPLCARIMAAADVLDALISLRTYKNPLPIEKAMEIFKESKGTHFEPCIAAAVIACKEQIEIIDKEFKARELQDFYKEVEEKHKYNEILKEQILAELQSNKG